MFLTTMRNLYTVFSKLAVSIYIPTNSTWACFPSHPLQNLGHFFKIIIILTDVKWYLIVVFIYILLMISDAEKFHIFSPYCVFLIWGGKCLLLCLPIFKLGYLLILHWVVIVFTHFEYSPWLRNMVCKYFPLTLALSFSWFFFIFCSVESF